MLTPEEQSEMQRLWEQNVPIRAIARRLGRDIKTIRRALDRPKAQTAPRKLEPYHDLIRKMFEKDLRSPRILRELRTRGYTGSRTILKDFLKTLAPQRPARKVFRRFETRRGEEAQSDWSPYRVPIAGQETIIHAFAMILCYSRRSFVSFYRNERLPTLLWAHQEAFQYHGGTCRRIAYDNQTAITLGRIDGKPRWNPAFLDFARHYGFEPSVGRPGHKERRGKVERPFHYLEEDFLRGRSFLSWEDLNQQVRHWLDTVANVRLHGTTRRRVDEAYAEEKPCLIALPEMPFPANRRETRKVQKDGYIPVDGSYYPTPAHLVGQWVTVRVSPMKVEILDAAGEIAAAYKVPDSPQRIPTEDVPLNPHPPGLSRSTLEARFLARFPGAATFLDGLKRRMIALTPIHLRAIERLADRYGDDAVTKAIDRATAYRNFNANALQRILERAHPTVVPETKIQPPSLQLDAFSALDDVDSGSPRDYTLDSIEPTEDPTDAQD
jgi:transposase